jgi:hypothetical protein
MPKLWRPVKNSGYYDREIKPVLLDALECDDREVLKYLEQVIKHKQVDLLLWKDDLPSAFQLLTESLAYYAAEFVAKHLLNHIPVNRDLQYIIAQEERDYEEAELYSDAQVTIYRNYTIVYCDCDEKWSYYTGCWTSSMQVFDDWTDGWHNTGGGNLHIDEEHAEWSSYRRVDTLPFNLKQINAVNKLKEIASTDGTVSVAYCKPCTLRPLPIPACGNETTALLY